MSENKEKNNIENNINDSIDLRQTNNLILLQLKEFGYNPIYSKKIIQYFQPQDIEEALDYLSINEGIIQHRFIKDRHVSNNVCYICGEIKEKHLGYNGEIMKEDSHLRDSSYVDIIDNKNSNNNENNIEKEKNSINLEGIKVDNIDNSNKQIICGICNETFISNSENTVKKCGHSYCNSCWYDFLSVQIQENKLPFIKCLNYECKEKLTDVFILYLLNNNIELIKKYEKYKLEFEILNNPNKKNCPFPNCDSYLELKDPKIKDVTCLNNHTFCFLCLQKPHGKLACNAKMDNDIIEFAKNNFVKKCPNCSIITEKSSGCNHITCSKCQFNWCWLCNGKYTNEHYKQGKCKGFQFFRPNDENEISLAFDGKIKLSSSQRQEDFYDNFEVNQNRNENYLRNYNHNDYIRRYNCRTTIFILFSYIMIGHGLYLLFNIHDAFMRNKFIKITVYIAYFFLEVANFFPMIYFNLIMLIPYLINQRFYRFIYYYTQFREKTEVKIIFNKFYQISSHLFFGSFFFTLVPQKYLRYDKNRYENFVSYFISFIFPIIYFPLQLLVNIFIIYIWRGYHLFEDIQTWDNYGAGFSFIL